ncbi:MAG TPA: hypothetical protein VL048_04235 [Xanthobacteraceae bacterium]|nr:hypothetical protein [Xanthobacteraceae bacterium]
MAHVKKGFSVSAQQWWNLRDWKRVFWKRQRQADKSASRRNIPGVRQEDV